MTKPGLLINGIQSRNLDQYKLLHTQKVYGQSSARRMPWIRPWIMDLRPATILDYGAGSSDTAIVMASLVGGEGFLFDPAIPEISVIPEAARDGVDLVISTHVLEHLDIDEIRAVLGQMKILSDNALIMVPTTIARQFLDNGENAHATIKPLAWWKKIIEEFYPYSQLVPSRGRTELTFITWEPKGKINMKVSKPNRMGIRQVVDTHINGKRIAVVGRAKSLVGSYEGELIDSYDTVIRINTPLDAREASARDVGRRTDLLFVRTDTTHYRILEKTERIIDTVATDLDFRRSLSEDDGYTPFTGTLVILELLAHGAAEVYATGMDLYVGPSVDGRGGHLRKRVGGGTHDPARDKLLLKQAFEDNPGRLKFSPKLESVIFAKDPPAHYRGLVPFYAGDTPQNDGLIDSIARTITRPNVKREIKKNITRRVNSVNITRLPKINVRGKIVAIVGRSKSLIGLNEGHKIDSADLVLRVNTILPLTHRHETDIGERTDIVYACCSCAIHEDAKRAALKHGAAFMATDKFRRKQLGDSYSLGYVPFSGTMAFVTMLEMGASQVYLTGVDLYTGPELIADARRKTYSAGKMKLSRKFHNLSLEKKLINNYLAQYPNAHVWEPLKEILSSETEPVHFKELIPT